jgi:hypothetical protein
MDLPESIGLTIPRQNKAAAVPALSQLIEAGWNRPMKKGGPKAAFSEIQRVTGSVLLLLVG